ncbi:MAG: hypothetical protein NWF05_08860 [Candidatus Bathyarchaeota archaeon]|nr:hypothetical protein [Candidatus Bathyarchaeota archaeon]
MLGLTGGWFWLSESPYPEGVARFVARDASRFPAVDKKAWLAYEESFDNDDDREVKSFDECDVEPLPEEGWGRFGKYEMVGHGRQTSEKCGTWRHVMKGCLNVDMHSIVTVDGQRYHGKVYYEKRFHSCDKPECPICFKRGWAVDEATRAEERFKKFSNGYVDKKGKKHAGLGLAEHIIVSPPASDYGLDFPALKKKCIMLLESLGVVGGLLIFHVSRYRNDYEAMKSGQPKGWYVSYHWHILGYIDGGYGRCRRCKKSRKCCLGCSGFEGSARRFNSGFDGKGKGYIFKVKDKRKTIHGTLWYQMNHAAFVRGKKENRVVFWFGVCSYRKAKDGSG